MVFSANNSILSVAKTLPPITNPLTFNLPLSIRWPQLLNVAFPAVLVPFWHPPLIHAIC
jgi:hypothetical protein